MEKEIRRHFSKIGFAYLAGSIVIYAVQFLAAMVGKKFVPAVMADPCRLWAGWSAGSRPRRLKEGK